MANDPVTVVGGGLAGMIAALRLAQRGFPVTILEASRRLGGKAGADVTGMDWDEHGWHLFPLWYLNIWSVVDELGIRGAFVDRHRYAYMRQGEYPRVKYLDTPFAWRTIWHNTFDGVLSPAASILYQYTLIDLLSQPFGKRAELDQVTINGFARTRLYTTETVVEQLEDTVSRASAIESYEMSAMTVRNVTRYWLRHNDPWFRILKGNLQTQFIRPIEQELIRLGVRIHLGSRVEALECAAGRVSRIVVRDENTGTASVLDVATLLLAVPAEALRDLVTHELFQFAPDLTGPFYLRSRAMAGMTVYFKRKLAGVPQDHVNFVDSPYDLSMIDVSDVWGEKDRTVLCVVASDYTPLQKTPAAVAERELLDDLARYLPFFQTEQIARVDLQPHMDEPLFMNTAGAWPRRPKSDVIHGNVVVAGDFCQSAIDLTCMEGAVSSGLIAAETIRRKHGTGEPIAIRVPQTYPRGLFLLLKVLLLPVAFIALIVHALRNRRESGGPPSDSQSKSGASSPVEPRGELSYGPERAKKTLSGR